MVDPPARPPRRGPFARFVLRRVLVGVAQLGILLILVFGLSLLMPGDAADVQSNDVLGGQQQDQARRLLGLDVAPVDRFATWVSRAVTGDLGTSYAGGEPVWQVVADPLRTSAILATLALAALVPVVAVAGFAAGTRPGSALDRVITAVCVAADSVPDFVLAVLLVNWLALDLDLLPATFLGVDSGDILAHPAYLVLPTIVIVARVAAPLVRLVRAGVIDVMDQPYIAQARRLGVPHRTLLTRHVAPNALAPAVQELGRTGDGLLSGVLIVEAVFVVPGIASELIGAIGNRDEPVVLAIVAVTGTAAVVINLIVDVIGQRMVPRSAEWDS